MECVYIGCSEHLTRHTTRVSHNFAMELSYGQMFCVRCEDYVYDMRLDQAALSNALRSKNCPKRVLHWSAGLEPQLVDGSLPKRIRITPKSTRGLRGLVNFGNTCFMNCIIQILVHTPLLREYFFSDRHKCQLPPGSCLVCELGRLFQEFFKEQTDPLVLNKLVYMTWIRAKELAGDEQQDAHHFFIATLEALHQECRDPSLADQPQHATKCSCIIDQIFSGQVQSDVVCKCCKGVSTKVDPLWDISLELGQRMGDPCQSSLIDCLERFTSTEHLGEVNLFMCSTCKSYQESTKQLTVKTLPIVLCFHLRRIKVNKDGNKKIETKIAFPEMLDMTPYMTPDSIRKPSAETSPDDNRYSLFAVVTHFGGPCTGHYIAYVRHQLDFWYKCDDHRIVASSLEQVLGAEGYLLFYHKHMLGYE